MLVCVNAIEYFLTFELLKENLVSFDDWVKFVEVLLVTHMNIQNLLFYDLLRLVVVEGDVPVQSALVVEDGPVRVVHRSESELKAQLVHVKHILRCVGTRFQNCGYVRMQSIQQFLDSLNSENHNDQVADKCHNCADRGRDRVFLIKVKLDGLREPVHPDPKIANRLQRRSTSI